MNLLGEIQAIGQELGVRPLVRARGWLYKKPPREYTKGRAPGRVPLVLLPGVGQRWGYLKPLANALARRGHPVYVIPELGSNLAPIPETAGRVRAFVEAHDLFGFVFVGHSKGGLVGKYCLAHYNGDQRALGLVAVATPFSGTYATRYAWHTPAYQEFAVTSPVILALQREMGVNSRIVSIYPEFDTDVWHEHKSWLEGASNIELPLGGHNALLGKRAVIAAVSKNVDRLAAVSGGGA